MSYVRSKGVESLFLIIMFRNVSILHFSKYIMPWLLAVSSEGAILFPCKGLLFSYKVSSLMDFCDWFPLFVRKVVFSGLGSRDLPQAVMDYMQTS